ncbi:MAG: hypothetical protein NTW95_03510 [Candidatus Aminicenantes bacterium]|nr:hypothetical protein [Candidatus Aminicenantes bacterium]
MKSTKSEWQKAGILFWGLAWLIAGNGMAAAQSGSDILAKLGLDPASAKESIMASLASGSVYNYEAIAAFKALPVAARAAIVQAGLGWIKAYVQGDEFKKSYLEFRGNKKPKPPAIRPSADEALKGQRAEFEKQIAETRKSMAGMDAEMKKTMETTIQQMRAQMEAMEKNPQQRELLRQMTEAACVEDKQRYEQELKNWEEQFPADFRVLIKKRLSDLLAISADVDFSAQLTPRDGKMVFVRDDYERKPSAWKICFRAGREATSTAHAFVKAWLVELAGI